MEKSEQPEHDLIQPNHNEQFNTQMKIQAQKQQRKINSQDAMIKSMPEASILCHDLQQEHSQRLNHSELNLNLKQNKISLFVNDVKQTLHQNRNKIIYALVGLSYLILITALILVASRPKNEGVLEKHDAQEISLNNSSTEAPVIEDDNVSVVITNAGGREKLLKQTLESFFEKNTYPIKKFIVAVDGTMGSGLKALAQIYKNITWMETGQKVGQLMATDMAYKLVDTEFYMHSEDDFVFLRGGFIEEGIKKLKRDPNSGGVIFKTWITYYSEHTNILDNRLCCYTFNPGLHRMSDYRKLEGGYSGVTYNYSYGKGAGEAEMALSYHYFKIGKYSSYLLEDFAIHIGYGYGLLKKDSANASLLNRDFSTLSDAEKGEYAIMFAFQDGNIKRSLATRQKRQKFLTGIYIGEQFSSIRLQRHPYNQLGLAKEIQIGTAFDFINFTKTPFYADFIDNVSRIINYDFYAERYTPYNTVQQILAQKNQNKLGLDPSKAYTEDYLLAMKLLQNPEDSTVSRVKTQLFDQNYAKHLQQSNLCILIEGTELEFENPKFEKLLISLRKQNYNKFILVFVGDDKSINSARVLAKSTKVYEKTQEIRGYQDHNKIGTNGMFTRMKIHCPKDYVIVRLSPTDQLIGSNVLRTISNAYADPDLMFATFRTIGIDSNNKFAQEVPNLNINLLKNFRADNTADLERFVKTYRHKLAVPEIVDYLFEMATKDPCDMIVPRFYPYTDDFQTYSLIEMAGSGVSFFNDMIVARQQMHEKEPCFRQKLDYIKAKAQLKTPLKPLVTLLEPVSKVPYYATPDKIVSKIKVRYLTYKKCLNGDNNEDKEEGKEEDKEEDNKF